MLMPLADTVKNRSEKLLCIRPLYVKKLFLNIILYLICSRLRNGRQCSSGRGRIVKRTQFSGRPGFQEPFDSVASGDCLTQGQPCATRLRLGLCLRVYVHQTCDAHQRVSY